MRVTLITLAVVLCAVQVFGNAQKKDVKVVKVDEKDKKDRRGEKITVISKNKNNNVNDIDIGGHGGRSHGSGEKSFGRSEGFGGDRQWSGDEHHGRSGSHERRHGSHERSRSHERSESRGQWWWRRYKQTNGGQTIQSGFPHHNGQSGFPRNIQSGFPHQGTWNHTWNHTGSGSGWPQGGFNGVQGGFWNNGPKNCSCTWYANSSLAGNCTFPAYDVETHQSQKGFSVCRAVCTAAQTIHWTDCTPVGTKFTTCSCWSLGYPAQTFSVPDVWSGSLFYGIRYKSCMQQCKRWSGRSHSRSDSDSRSDRRRHHGRRGSRSDRRDSRSWSSRSDSNERFRIGRRHHRRHHSDSRPMGAESPFAKKA